MVPSKQDALRHVKSVQEYISNRFSEYTLSHYERVCTVRDHVTLIMRPIDVRCLEDEGYGMGSATHVE